MATNMREPGDFRPGDLVGTSIKRREDPRLITGEAEYTDDIQYPRLGHLAILRSQYAHARITGIDTTRAAALDGVYAVVTQADVEASDARGTLRTDSPDDGVAPEHPLLARDKVTYQGHPIAGVVAADRYTAHDALDLIDVSYDPIDPVVAPMDALESGAAVIHEEAPDNVAFRWDTGDQSATETALDDADHVVPVPLEINRVLPTAMEPRAAVARYARSSGELTVEMSTQNPHQVRSDVSSTLDIPDHRIRVRAPDVGGGFGAKLQPYAGHLLAAWCAVELGRPVKWVASRSEDCQAMVHSRHHLIDAEVGVDADGRIRGVRANNHVPVGGYLVPGGAGVPTNLGLMANGQYAIPAMYVHITGVFTNTAPLSAYRGAGRPEATYFIERVVRSVAGAFELDPVAVRRRNFIQPEQFPYESGLGRTYDSGEYERTLEKALSLVGYEAFRDRQADRRDAGEYTGVGVSCYVEACGAAPGWHETGAVEFMPSGRVVVRTGTAEIGGGHRTSYAQIAARVLGVPFDDVEVLDGDTNQTVSGGGTAGSRAMPVAGSAVMESAEEVREQARRIAAHRLEAGVEDVEFADGEFFIRGAPDRSIGIQEVAGLSHAGEVPEGMGTGLSATTYFDPPNYTFPFGTHVALVTVDPDAGEVSIDRYVAVDDVGRQINPKLVEGQIHGGVGQGIGQALQEEAVYDENGNLLSGSLQDYAIPKPAHVPEIEWDSTVTPCPHNPLGVKGVGEAGAIAAPPAVVNAVVDALSPLGVSNIDMPVTPERVWRAVRDQS